MNHKPWATRMVHVGSVIKYATQLTYYHYNGESTPKTLQNMDAAGAYSVPTGKNFVPTSLSVKTDGTVVTVTLGKSNSLDTITSTLETFVIPAYAGWHTYNTKYNEVNTTYLAVDSSDTGVEEFMVTGNLIEENP